ncbi:MAG: GTP-binding protein [Spirochaetales bacterium]|nr:GTP-binding protein [Spirochaetales bacterium]
MDRKIDLVLLTGFLGSGKTTLLNRLLDFYADREIGILVNDFGKLPVDGSLIRGEQERKGDATSRIFEIANGSIFCSCLTASFILGLKYFIKECPEILFVETSGLSDPSGLRRLLREHKIFNHFRIKETICVLDAVRVPALRSSLVVIDRQIEAADLILVNKADLADQSAMAVLHDDIRKINPGAVVENTSYCKFDFQKLDSLVPVIKNGELQSCNSPDTRQAETILQQKEVEKDELFTFLKAIEAFVLRFKGYFSVGEELYFCTDNSGKIESALVEPFPGIRKGFSLICFKEDLEEIIRIWNKL